MESTTEWEMGAGRTHQPHSLGTGDNCLFVWFDSLRSINNLSVIQERVFLG